jgi:atypical dual specificity phosphatase
MLPNKYFMYITSLSLARALVKCGLRDEYNKIGDDNLYLGMIPLQHNIDEIKKLNITSIISLLEEFEFNESFIGKPINHNEWKDIKIKTYHISAVDFIRMNLDDLIRGVEYLSNELKNGEAVYIHCKAGVGRSATVVAGYLMTKHMIKVEDAIELLKKFRPCININDDQKITLNEYAKIIFNN